MKYDTLPDFMSSIEYFIKENPTTPLMPNDNAEKLMVGFKATLDDGSEQTWSIGISRIKDISHLTGAQHQIFTDLFVGKKK